MATKKVTAAKKAVKKTVTATKSPVGKSAASSAAGKKTVAKKATAGKVAAKKPTQPKKAAAAKPAAPVKKAASKPVTTKSSTATGKATGAKKAASKSTATKKTAAPKKAAATKKTAVAKKAAPAKAAVVKKATVKKAVAGKSTAKASATKKSTTPAKSSPSSSKSPASTAKKVAGKTAKPKASTAVKKSTEKKVATSTVKKTATPVKKTAAKKAPAKKRSSSRNAALPQPTKVEHILDAVQDLPKKTNRKNGKVIAIRPVEKAEEKTEHELTMQQYHPKTKSVLDTPEQTAGPVYRYSDEDLAEFKELILKRLENARKELAYLQGLITRKDEAGTEDTDNRFNHMEDGSGAMEREQLSQLAGRQIQFIGHLENALIRIENKTYGICRVTGKLIEKARLKAVPHATLSIEAKNAMKK